MVWQRNSHPQIRKTLQYFDKYDYPLTKRELEYWSGVKVSKYKSVKDYFYLPRRQKLIKLRSQREKYSLLKWGIAYSQATKLAKLPFIAAIFVTGSLAMSNCKKSDDIDLMIITHANTLWITRFLVNIFFLKNRRFPGTKTAPDKICTNLWLDTRNLKIPDQSLYHAHEILQTKCIFDRGGVQYQFLKQNSWVKDYLPNAYKQSFENLKFKNIKLITCPQMLSASAECRRENYKLKIINYILYWAQWLYMKPKMTTERVGPGFAFFHPRK